MSKYEKLEAIAASLGESLDELIPRVITEEGSIFKAAQRLGVYPNTIQNWIKRNNYRLTTRQVATLEKETTDATRS